MTQYSVPAGFAELVRTARADALGWWPPEPDALGWWPPEPDALGWWPPEPDALVGSTRECVRAVASNQ